jgi:hypothetical protein
MNFRGRQGQRGKRRLSQSVRAATFNGEEDMCEVLFKLRDADYAEYAPNHVQEEYRCEDLKTCKSDTDYLLTKHYDQCYLRTSPLISTSKHVPLRAQYCTY